MMPNPLQGLYYYPRQPNKFNWIWIILALFLFLLLIGRVKAEINYSDEEIAKVIGKAER